MDADMAGISDLSEISSKAPFGHTGIQCPTAIDGNRLEAKAILKPGPITWSAIVAEQYSYGFQVRFSGRKFWLRGL